VVSGFFNSDADSLNGSNFDGSDFDGSGFFGSDSVDVSEIRDCCLFCRLKPFRVLSFVFGINYPLSSSYRY
jgi:hypothetical protein